MTKTKNFCKKPLLILSLCLVAVFAAALIIMAVVPYAATPYTYTNEGTYTTTVSKYYVSKDELKVENQITTNSGSTTNPAPTTNNAYVKEGVLYVENFEFGEIDAYKLVISENVVAVNNFTNTLKIVSIVGVSLGGVGLVLYFVLNNKGSKKKTTKKSSKKK